MNRWCFFIAIVVNAVALGQTTQPVINLSVDVEDGKKMLHAVVTLDGKPRENVVLDYFAQRSFGNLSLGEDTTLDDGTSAVAFPTDLPGSTDGNLHVIAKIKSPQAFESVSTTQAFPADRQPQVSSNQFPRALWAPNAPLALTISIFVMLAVVWGSYLFVFSRVLAIRRGGTL
jgi:hypothetical protein